MHGPIVGKLRTSLIISFDLKERTACFAQDSLRADGDKYRLFQLVMEGSQDGSNLEELGRRSTRELNDGNTMKTYLWHYRNAESVRCLIGKNGVAKSYVQLPEIEFCISSEISEVGSEV